MDTQVRDAVAKYNVVSKVEAETGKPLTGIKRKILSSLNADQVIEFAQIIHAEVGALGYERDLLPAVPAAKDGSRA
jgi:hypothetical protein